MKTTIILIAILVLGACRSTKQINKTDFESNKKETTSVTHRSVYEWMHLDSAMHYWYFATQQPFYYHPDSGLYAGNGTLLTSSLSVRQQINMQDTFSEVSMLRDSTVAMTKTDYQYQTDPRLMTNWKAYAFGLLLLVFIAIYWRKKWCFGSQS